MVVGGIKIMVTHLLYLKEAEKQMDYEIHYNLRQKRVIPYMCCFYFMGFTFRFKIEPVANGIYIKF